MGQKVNPTGLRLGINGVWGNMGVALAPVLTGFLIAYADWRLAFMLPAIFCIIFGITQLLAFIELDESTSNSKSEIQNQNNQLIKEWDVDGIDNSPKYETKDEL